MAIGKRITPTGGKPPLVRSLMRLFSPALGFRVSVFQIVGNGAQIYLTQAGEAQPCVPSDRARRPSSGHRSSVSSSASCCGVPKKSFVDGRQPFVALIAYAPPHMTVSTVKHRPIA